MSRKKISTTIYVTPEQSDKLKLLHERTKVPVAVYIREGIDLVLKQYANLLPGQLALDASDGRKMTRAERQSSARLPVAAVSEVGGSSDDDDDEREPAPIERAQRATMKDGTNSAAAGGGKK